MINDSSIRVIFGPSIEAPYYGKAFFGNGEIGIAERAFRMGRWTVLAIIIQEFAHLNGPPGHGGDTCAEEAAHHCGPGTREEYYDLVVDPSTPYNPH